MAKEPLTPSLPINPTDVDFDKSEAEIREALAIYRKRGIRGKRIVHALWALQLVLDMRHKYEQMDGVVNQAIGGRPGTGRSMLGTFGNSTWPDQRQGIQWTSG